MKKTKEIEVADKKIVVSELSVKEVSQLLEEMAADGQQVMANQKALSTIDLLFGAEASGSVISKCTGIPIEELENDFSPSEIRMIIDEVKTMNTFFFEMLSKLVKAQESLQLPPS